LPDLASYSNHFWTKPGTVVFHQLSLGIISRFSPASLIYIPKPPNSHLHPRLCVLKVRVMASSADSPVDHLSPTNKDSSALHPKQTPAWSGQVLEQPVNFVQSLELVRTTVCAVVSTVASLRCLFPEDCFRVHCYDLESPNYSYKDFMKATSGDSTTVVNARKKVDHRYVPWDILVRGTKSGVNKLLDWIVSCT
jgi:HORMA domain